MRLGSTRLHRELAWLAVPVAALALLYGRTLCRAVVPGDSAELVTGAVTLGLVHPTGYPLYLLVAHVASRIAFFAAPQAAIAALSAFAALVLLVCLARSLRDAGAPYIAAAGASVVLGVTPSLWHAATYAEVYTLHGALIAALLWTLVRASAPAHGARATQASCLAAYGLGLGCGAHMTTLLFVPGFLAWLLVNHRAAARAANSTAAPKMAAPKTAAAQRYASPRVCAALVACAALGASVLAVLPLFDRPDRLNYLNPHDAPAALRTAGAWPRFVYLVSAAQFGAGSNLGSRFFTPDFPSQVLWLLRRAVHDNLVLWALGTTGLAIPWASNHATRTRALRVFLILALGAWIAYFATYQRFFQDSFFVVPGVVLGFGAGQCLAWIVRRRFGRLLGATLVAATAVTLVATRFESLDLHDASEFETKSARLFAAVEPDAVVCCTWTYSTLFWFHRWVQGMQPGVQIVNAVPSEWLQRAAAFPNRRRYFERLPPGADPAAFERFGWFYRDRRAPQPGG
jgi:hypothetical protein